MRCYGEAAWYGCRRSYTAVVGGAQHLGLSCARVGLLVHAVCGRAQPACNGRPTASGQRENGASERPVSFARTAVGDHGTGGRSLASSVVAPYCSFEKHASFEASVLGGRVAQRLGHVRAAAAARIRVGRQHRVVDDGLAAERPARPMSAPAGRLGGVCKHRDSAGCGSPRPRPRRGCIPSACLQTTATPGAQLMLGDAASSERKDPSGRVRARFGGPRKRSRGNFKNRQSACPHLPPRRQAPPRSLALPRLLQERACNLTAYIHGPTFARPCPVSAMIEADRSRLEHVRRGT